MIGSDLPSASPRAWLSKVLSTRLRRNTLLQWAVLILLSVPICQSGIVTSPDDCKQQEQDCSFQGFEAFA